MYSIKKLFLLLLFVGLAFAEIGEFEQLKAKPPVIVHELNLSTTFDNVLPYIRRYITINGFDPMEIQDVEVPLSLLPDLFKTKMHLHHGNMQQLSTVYRNGDIILQWTKDKMSFFLNIGFKTIDLSYEYTLRYLLYTRKGDCYGRYHDVKASMLIDVDLKQTKVMLRFFKFLGVGDFKLKLEGHLTDKLLNILSKVIVKMFRTQVLRIIEATTSLEVDKQIQEFNEIIPDDLRLIIQKIIDSLELEDITTHTRAEF